MFTVGVHDGQKLFGIQATGGHGRVHVSDISHVRRPLELTHDGVHPHRTRVLRARNEIKDGIRSPVGRGEDANPTERPGFPEGGILADQPAHAAPRNARMFPVREGAVMLIHPRLQGLHEEVHVGIAFPATIGRMDPWIVFVKAVDASVVDGHNDASGIPLGIQGIESLVNLPFPRKRGGHIEAVLSVVEVKDAVVVVGVRVARWCIDPECAIPLQLWHEDLGLDDLHAWACGRP